MHIAIFLDQHPESIGGVQTSVRLQKKYLESLGHRVTLVCATWKSQLRSAPRPDVIEIPSVAMTLDGEFSFARFDRKVRKQLLDRLNKLPTIDLVHIQADYSIAILGHWFAKLSGLPLLHTFHTWLEETHSRTVPFPDFAARLLGNIQASVLQLPESMKARNSSEYLQNFAQNADRCFAPSHHFAEKLERHGISERVHVMPTGIDDTMLHLIHSSQNKLAGHVTTILWVGRLAPEKRILEFIHSITRLSYPAKVEIYGTGQLHQRARALIIELHLEGHVTLKGKQPHHTTLNAIAHADVLVQNSVGIETQGMTAYEAACLGTPIILSDAAIAQEIAGNRNLPQIMVTPHSGIDALAQTLNHFLAENQKRPQVKEPYLRLKQSQLTAHMADHYEEVVARKTPQPQMLSSLSNS